MWQISAKNAGLSEKNVWKLFKTWHFAESRNHFWVCFDSHLQAHQLHYWQSPLHTTPITPIVLSKRVLWRARYDIVELLEITYTILSYSWLCNLYAKFWWIANCGKCNMIARTHKSLMPNIISLTTKCSHSIFYIHFSKCLVTWLKLCPACFLNITLLYSHTLPYYSLQFYYRF